MTALKPIAVVGRKGTDKGDTIARRYADQLDKVQRMERELARAFNRWDKARRTLHRYEKELEQYTMHC